MTFFEFILTVLILVAAFAIVSINAVLGWILVDAYDDGFPDGTGWIFVPFIIEALVIAYNMIAGLI